MLTAPHSSSFTGAGHTFFFLNCECFYVQPRIQRSFTATSQLAGPIFPSIHRTAVRYSCKVTTVKILRYSQKSWDAALCCSDFIVKSHMPSLCLQSATVFFFKTPGQENASLSNSSMSCFKYQAHRQNKRLGFCPSRTTGFSLRVTRSTQGSFSYALVHSRRLEGKKYK